MPKTPQHLIDKATKWNRENKERRREIANAYYARNKEKAANYAAGLTPEQAARKRASTAAWAAANRQKRVDQARARRQSDPVAARARDKAQRERNRESARERVRRRRAKKAGADGHHTTADAVAIRIAQRDRCAYCRSRLRGGGHLDHIVALSQGGSDWPRNLQWLCSPCNTGKATTDPAVYARRIGLLV